MADNTALFRKKAPPIMRKLMRDFPWSELDAAAVLGNIGGETGGFVHMQEIKPLVAGSAGGFGFCQWTGPRRRAFMAWAASKGLKPESDEANYGFLVHELRTSESRTVDAVRRAGAGLEEKAALAAKVVAFERTFERAGIPHHASRIRWAERAIAEYRKAPLPPAVTKTIGTVAAGGAAATAAKGNGWSASDAIGIGLFVLVGLAVLLFILSRRKK
jgi:hypothetical protein